MQVSDIYQVPLWDPQATYSITTRASSSSTSSSWQPLQPGFYLPATSAHTRILPAPGESTPWVWNIEDRCLHPDRQPMIAPEDYDASGGEILECPDCGKLWIKSTTMGITLAVECLEVAYDYCFY